MTDVPVFIVTRDRVTDLLALVAWLEYAGHERIYFLDNDSTYEPLLEYFRETCHTVIPLGRNLGSRALWEAGLAPRNEPYVLTDPDIVPTEDCPLDAIGRLQSLLDRYPQWPKAALGLHLDDVPADMRSLGVEREWVARHRELEPGVYGCMSDTTFAVYRPGSAFRYEALRTGAPWTARHMPWYRDGSPSEEELFYLARAESGSLFSSWKTAIG